MATFNIELNNRPQKGTNEHSIMLRITVNQKHARISLMYSVSPNQFNKNGRGKKYIRTSHPNHKKINSYIEERLEKAKEVVAELEKEGKTITSEIVRSKILQPKTFDLIVFAEDYKSELLKSGSAGTYKKYRTILSSLKKFANKDMLYFDEIDTDFLLRYHNHLKECGLVQNTIHSYIGRIRSLFNKAIQKGYLAPGSSPFQNIRIAQGSVMKDRLNIMEISKIEQLELKEFSLIWHVKNAFLFSFYNAGIRISDILLLKWDMIKNGRIAYNMYKTSKTHSLVLKEKPLAILEKYMNKDNTFVFPFLSDRFDYSNPMFLHDQIVTKTALINKYLKEIAKKAGINKKITTHTARHSFADIARQKTDNIYNLSKTLGHSSIKVTEAYLASFDEKAVDDTLDSVFN